MARHGASLEAERRANAKFSRERLKQVKLALNDRTDADIISFLETIENKRSYILGLIRADMTKRAEKSN